MDDLQIVLEELEAADHVGCHAHENAFRDTAELEFVHAAGIHKLHAVVDARLDEEGSVEVYNLWCAGAVQDIEFHDDGVEFAVLELEPNFLRWEGSGVSMRSLFDRRRKQSGSSGTLNRAAK